MAHLGLVRQVEEIGIDFVLGEGAEGQRRHEFGAGLGEDGARGDSGFAQQADQFQTFIGGDAAADDQ